jgi:hypothetical protein
MPTYWCLGLIMFTLVLTTYLAICWSPLYLSIIVVRTFSCTINVHHTQNRTEQNRTEQNRKKKDWQTCTSCPTFCTCLSVWFSLFCVWCSVCLSVCLCLCLCLCLSRLLFRLLVSLLVPLACPVCLSNLYAHTPHSPSPPSECVLPPTKTNGGFIKDEYCSWVQYKSGPGGRPSM